MEPDISPLAKRLAEENNVNWRGLGGSGANGRIVERDVLEYLAKVMAGEEDLNPTAEPIPEGMDAWPEEDTAGYFKDSPSIETTDTLTEVVTDQPSVSVEEVADPFGMDEPMLDLEPEPLMVDSSDDIFAAEVDEVASTAAPDEASDVQISEDIFLFDEEPSSPEAVDESAFTSSDAEMDTAAPQTDTAPFVDFGTETPADAETNADSFAAVEAEFTEVPVLEDVEADALMSDAETVSVNEVERAEPETDLFGDDAPAESDDSVLFSDASEDASRDDTRLEPIAEAVDSAPTETDGVAGIESETIVPVPPLPSQALPLSTFGVLLRRHADLGAAMQAQLSISHELGHSEPVELSNLLVRAAAKALQTSDIANAQGVGLALFEEAGVRVAPVANAHTKPFRELLEHLANLDANDASAVGLAVADMSDLGVDEAVLNLDMPVLALGRILQDSEQGSQRSTLTLSGNVPVETGTKFLSAVAELLASPIRLIL